MSFTNNYIPVGGYDNIFYSPISENRKIKRISKFKIELKKHNFYLENDKWIRIIE